jgi:hypothetical protein
MSNAVPLVIPPDFEDLLKALSVAARIQRPLELHDEALRTALFVRGFTTPFGAGFVGTVLLDETLKLPGAAQMVTLLLQAPAPTLVARPSYAPIEPPVTAAVSATATSHPTPPAPPKRRIELSPAEREILRHSQVLGVAVDSLQRELDTMLNVLRPHFEEIEDPSQMLELSKTLPPSALRKLLEEKSAGA